MGSIGAQTRNLGVNLAGVGVEIAVALAAQSAEARTSVCPGNGGTHQQQIEVGEPCPTYYSPMDATAYTADNVAVSFTATIENGEDLLEPGTVIEVEIDLNDVVALLKNNEREALVLASSAGVRPGAGLKVDRMTAARLSDAETKAVAEYVLANMQGRRATGRSDPAGPNTTRREAWYTATIRAIGSAVRDAFQPRASARGVREVTVHPDGRRTYRTEVQIDINTA